MEKKSVAILVNSCDLYEDAWDPFFRLLKIQWPECSYEIYLNTEKKSYICDFLNVKTIKTGNEPNWTSRTKKALNEIDSEYILFMLEDFFLQGKVDEKKFEFVLSRVKKDNVGFLFFPPSGVKSEIKGKNGEIYSDVSKYCDYRVNACIGLWKKEFFLQMLYLEGNPWEFEHNATRLSKIANYRCCVTEQEYSSLFLYSMLTTDGYGITQKKWLPKNKELFSKYGIEVNFEGLGIKDTSKKNNNKEQSTSKIESKFKLRRRFEKHKKRCEKNIRYFKDVIFLKPKLKKYCKEISNNSSK